MHKKLKISKKLNANLVMPHKKFEDFLLKVTGLLALT